MGVVVMPIPAAIRAAAGDPCKEVDAAAAGGTATDRRTALNNVVLADNRPSWRLGESPRFELRSWTFLDRCKAVGFILGELALWRGFPHADLGGGYDGVDGGGGLFVGR